MTGSATRGPSRRRRSLPTRESRAGPAGRMRFPVVQQDNRNSSMSSDLTTVTYQETPNGLKMTTRPHKVTMPNSMARKY